MAILFFKQSVFIKNIGLKHHVISALFILKIAGGILYHYIMTVRFYGGDSHGYYMEVIGHLQNLSVNWREELKFFFTCWTSIEWQQNLYSKQNAIAWSDIGSQLNIRIMYVSNILSFGRETVNIIFYNFLFFLGQLALFKTLYLIAPAKKHLLLITVFLIPSVWFWCSGMHKDGFILSLVGMLVLALYNWQKNYGTKYLVYIILALAGLFCIRYYTCLLIVPILITYFTAYYFQQKLAIWKTYLIGFLVSAGCFFVIPIFTKNINPAEMVSYKQTQFLQLKGNSYIAMDTLQPNLKSFIVLAPKALNRSLLRPYLTDSKDFMYFITSLETILLFGLMLYLLFGAKKMTTHKSLIYFMLSISLIMFLIIGYIVPFSGAFIRYRAAYYPLFFGALFLTTNSKIILKIEKTICYKLKNNSLFFT